MYGFYNRVLHIDISRRSFKEEGIGDDLLRRTLGGKGLGTHLLLHNTRAGVDPLSPDNAIIFATGPATDLKVFGSSRYGVYTKSPLTGYYCESYSGGSVAGPLGKTGYDAVVLKGASEKPVCIEVSHGNVRFRDASHLWGKDTYATEDAIRVELGMEDAGIAVIGPAAENLVRFGVIENDYWHSAGRAGAGTVLGSKKVKAIVFHGARQREAARPALLDEVWKETGAKSQTDKGVISYRNLGTPMLVATTNAAGTFPTQYWSRGTFERWRNISADALREKCRVTSMSCPRCFIGCGKLTEVTDGRHKGLRIEGPEYETIYAFGGLCMIDDIREIAFLNDICDRLGMDTMTSGNLAAFTIEASQRKAIDEKLEYGDAEGVAVLLWKIARREGVGAVLADGIIHASHEWGLEDIAVHVKGLEPAGYDPRVLRGMGLAYAISDRGADHLRATVYKAELSGIIPPDRIEGKAEVLVDFEDRHTLFDSLILCRFFRDLYPWDILARIIEGTTGLALDKAGMQGLAGHITDLAREFNLREGMTPADDTLPSRFFNERLADSGKILPRADFEQLLSDYYRLRGWGAPCGDSQESKK